jgi:WD40 repeat protein/predicted Ser/Thr protein kinase
MNSNKCPRCGALKLAALEGNCPKCLIHLGAPDRAAAGADTPASGAPLPHLGDYELLDEIARGGMGVVYRARQLSLNRIVAVKLLLAGEFADETFIQRFRREAEAAASLNHPNIVSIHEVGEEEGRAYFSMEMIEGRTLGEVARESPLPARRAAQLVKTIAEAVHFAHERGLLHRDLKPSNVMVDAQGVPHITDFGLAKRLAAPNEELTLTGQVLGSPNYMPPEQADPKIGQATVASDVYSLGAIFYHLLTGRAPFMAETLPQTLRLVAETEPVSPRLLNPDVPRDLETICCKCLEKEPQRRYASASELGEELGRYLSDEPICARPIGLPGRWIRWCRRKPALAFSTTAAVLLLFVIAIGSPMALIRIDNERQVAEAASKKQSALRVRAESAERQTQQQLFAALLEQARATVRAGELGHRVRALDALRRAAAISNSADLRREVLAALALPDLRFEREWSLGSELTLARMDPNFERLAICYGRGPVQVRSVSDDRLLATLPPSTNLMAHRALWSPDGRFLAVKRDYDFPGHRGDLEIWDVANQRRVLLLVRDMRWNAWSFHPRQSRILTAGTGGSITGRELPEGNEVVRYTLLQTPKHMTYSPTGDRIAVAYPLDNKWVVSVHDAVDGMLLSSHTFSNQVACLEWHPAGRLIAAGEFNGAVNVIESITGQANVLGYHKLNAVLMAFTPDGDYLFSGGWEREFICWDVSARRPVFTAALESFDLHFRADGGECAIKTETGGQLQLHAFEKPSGYRELPVNLGTRLRHAKFSPDGRWLAASSEKGAAIWDLVNGGPATRIDEAFDAHFSFTAGPSLDGHQPARLPNQELFGSRTTGKPGCFRWQITPAKSPEFPPDVESLPINKPEGFTFLCALSNSVVMTGAKGSQILPIPTNIDDRSAALKPRPDSWVLTSAGTSGVSPDGRWLAIHRPFSSSLSMYRLPSFEPAAILTHPFSFVGFEFAPAGDEIAIYSSRGGVEFWSTDKWRRTRTLTNFIDILFAADGGGLWLSRDFRRAGLYDARTLHPLLPLPDGMLALALSADGRYLAVTVDGRRLQVWDIAGVRSQLRPLGLDWPDHAAEIRTAQR